MSLDEHVPIRKRGHLSWRLTKFNCNNFLFEFPLTDMVSKQFSKSKKVKRFSLLENCAQKDIIVSLLQSSDLFDPSLIICVQRDCTQGSSENISSIKRGILMFPRDYKSSFEYFNTFNTFDRLYPGISAVGPT